MRTELDALGDGVEARFRHLQRQSLEQVEVELADAGPAQSSEMHFVAALDRVEGMRVVLGLFEGAVTGINRVADWRAGA
jgi:hypothetical protein